MIPAPLYRDPIFDGPADPMIIRKASDGKFYMFYTQRRANQQVVGVSFAYGTAIGAVVIFLINNVLNMLDVGTSWQSACQGMVLIISLMIASLETRHRNK